VAPEEKGARELETAFGDDVSSAGAHGAKSLQGIAVMNDRQTAELALTKVLRLERRQRYWIGAVLGLLAVVALLVSMVVGPRAPEPSPDASTKYDRALRRFAVALAADSDCNTPEEVVRVCEDGAQEMHEPSHRFLPIVAGIVAEIHERAPAQRVPLRRLVRLMVDLARLCPDFGQLERLIPGLLSKPPSEQPPDEQRKFAICAITRTAGTTYEPGADLVDQLAWQFERENLHFSRNMESWEVYNTQVRQDDLAVLALRPLGVPARSPTRPDSQQP
jgi:hypothetical protein